MGQWGEAFGIPFAFEGLFFFTEAIFIAIYIYGWRRLKPWTHFWTGVPIVIAGIRGTVSVVAANAWMNAPDGLHARRRRARSSTSTRSSVIFNDAMPLRPPTCSSPPTSSAASSSRRCTRSACCGAGATATTGSASSSRSPWPRSPTPIQMGVGDSLARWVYNNQPVKFAAIELVPKTESDVPETLLGRLNSDGT